MPIRFDPGLPNRAGMAAATSRIDSPDTRLPTTNGWRRGANLLANGEAVAYSGEADRAVGDLVCGWADMARGTIFPRVVAILAVCALAIATRGASAQATSAPIHRVPTGFISDWLICGPFPNPLPAGTARNEHTSPCVGFETDYLTEQGGEGAIEPVVGMAHKSPDGRTIAWRPVTTPTVFVNFDAEFKPNDNVVAYAACYLESPIAQNVVLSVGSDDGIKIWIDDRLVHDHHIGRAAAPDQDIVVVRLRRGIHRCLVKVDEGHGEWGFYLRAQTTGGAAAAARLNFENLVSLHTSPTLAMPGDLISAWVYDPERARLFDIAYPVRYSVANLSGDRIVALSARTDSPAVLHTRTWPAGGYRLSAEIDPPGSGTIRLDTYIFVGDFERAVDRFMREAPVATDERSRAGMTLAYCAKRVETLRQAGRKAMRDSADEIIEYIGWFEQFRAGNFSDDIFRDRKGSHVRAYRSPIDDTPQYYALYVPSSYERGVPTPLVVSLHGYDPFNRPYAARDRRVGEKLRRLAEQYGYIVLEPFGRGNAQYRGIGRLDVLEAIEQVCSDYDIDGDRIYLMGYSMGGSGTWSLGTFHADRFAAIAPIYGGWPYELPPGQPGPALAFESFVAQRDNPFLCAENLLNTPVFINHGDHDELINVEYSRRMARRLARLGYDVRYWEHPGKGHGNLDVEATLFRWFERRTRPAAPSRVRLKAGLLRHARMDWVAVERFEHLMDFATVDARIAAGNLVAIESRNVSVMTLTPPAGLIAPDRPLDVIWNGREADVERIGERAWRLVSPETPKRLLTAPLRKTAALEGPMNDVWTSPFLIVRGTQASDPLMEAVVAAETRSIFDWWRQWQHAAPRIKNDTDVTTGDMAAYNLVVVGPPDGNFIARRLLAELPVRIAASSIEFFGEKFNGADLGLAMIYPNPLYPNRYVMFLLGNSPAGLFGLAARCDERFDFFIADGRTIGGARAVKTSLAAGFFDQQWEYRPQYVVRGNDRARADVGIPNRAPRYRSVASAPKKLFLSDLLPVRRLGTFRDMALDRSAFGEPLRLGKKRLLRSNICRKGIASRVAHGLNLVEYDLAGRYEKLRALVGVQLSGSAEPTRLERTNTRVIFSVIGDGETLWQSPPMGCGSSPAELDLDITGVRRLGLSVRNEHLWHYRADSANWYKARIER